MLLRILKHIYKKQKGFTSLELLAVIAITSIIGSGLLVTINQTIKGSNTVKNNMTAINDVRNAGYWMTRDIQMMQYISNTPTSFQLTDGVGYLNILRSDYIYDLYKVTYHISSGALIRSEFRSLDPYNPDAWDQLDSVVVANNIISVSGAYPDPDSPPADNNTIVKITIKSTVGTGSNIKNAEETYRIQPRNELI